jgi:hypothetical protein
MRLATSTEGESLMISVVPLNVPIEPLLSLRRVNLDFISFDISEFFALMLVKVEEPWLSPIP